jgi:cobalt-zinc-cadmium efflux system protein
LQIWSHEASRRSRSGVKDLFSAPFEFVLFYLSMESNSKPPRGDHSHEDGHDHSHGHDHHSHSNDDQSHGLSGLLGGGHHHHHPVSRFGRAFAIGIVLNLGFVAIEGAYGFFSNSLALLSDAGHNLSDVLGLFLAWFATWLARRRPSAQFTYGLRSSSILAAVINAVVLLVAVGGIIWEAILRFNSPTPVNSLIVMTVAAVGILVNGVTAALFASGSKSDLNIRAAFLHMLADALISLGVVIAGFIMMKTGYAWIDPVVSIIIGLVIIWGTWGLLKDSIFMALAGVPSGIETSKVESYLLSHPEVARVHDLHIWALSTSQTALTAHLVCSAENGAAPADQFLFKLSDHLNKEFGIGHSTIQIERGDADCPQGGEDCV